MTPYLYERGSLGNALGFVPQQSALLFGQPARDGLSGLPTRLELGRWRKWFRRSQGESTILRFVASVRGYTADADYC